MTPVISAGDLVERLLATTMGVHMGSGYQRLPPPLQVEAAARIQELEALVENTHRAYQAERTGLGLRADHAIRRADAAEAHLRDIIRAHDANSGNEPSVSVFERAIDLARSSLNQDGGKP